MLLQNGMKAPVILAMSILLAGCTSSDIPDLPSPDVPSSSSAGGSPGAGSSSSVAISSSAGIQSWCVYLSTEQCFPVSFSECPSGGFLALSCPFGSSSSFSSSSGAVGIIGSSSSLGNSSSGGSSSFSSSSVLPEYAWCVFAQEQTCLPGPASVCPPGGTLANVCGYSSSSSSGGGVVSSSSSFGGVVGGVSSSSYSSSVAKSSSSVGGGLSSSSIGYNGNDVCEYDSSWCGGIDINNIRMNSIDFSSGTPEECLFIKGGRISTNEDALINNVLINNVSVGKVYEKSLGDWPKVDGGYYIYRPAGNWVAISGAISGYSECAVIYILGVAHEKCGDKYYNTETQFCLNVDGIYYRTVAIGNQIWLDRDLMFNGSGRFDWATAMNLPSSCNDAVSCASQINVPHQGICPSGWHLPESSEVGNKSIVLNDLLNDHWTASECGGFACAVKFGNGWTGQENRIVSLPVRCLKN
jgi:hypothetical protein